MMATRVSIGLPVYNGQNYVSEAIDSILAQTYSDFELIISDNGSTDSTQHICQAYATKDTRVKYHRIDVNQGATWNFNRVVELATGEYFRWAAHDDRLAPSCIEKCVAILDAQPEVVLCHSQVELIDAAGTSRGVYHDAPVDTAGTNPSARFGNLIAGHRCFEVFGLMRLKALRSVAPLGAYGHADGILLSRIGLLGRFHEIAEPLFAERMHPGQSMNTYGSHTGKASKADGPPDYHAYVAWYDPRKSGKLVFPYWRMLGEHCKSVVTAQRLGVSERVYCGLHVLQWTRKHRYWLGRDLKIAARGVRKGQPT